MFRIRTMQVVLAELGREQSLVDTFKNRRTALVDFCIQQKGRHVRVDWSLIDRKTLDLQRVEEMGLEQPVDEYWDYALYCERTAASKLRRCTAGVVNRTVCSRRSF